MTATATRIQITAPATVPTMPRHVWAGTTARLRPTMATYQWELRHTFTVQPCPCERCNRFDGVFAVRNRAGRYLLTSTNSRGYTLTCVTGRSLLPAD